jgi:hypothetical protein
LNQRVLLRLLLLVPYLLLVMKHGSLLKIKEPLICKTAGCCKALRHSKGPWSQLVSPGTAPRLC